MYQKFDFLNLPKIQRVKRGIQIEPLTMESLLRVLILDKLRWPKVKTLYFSKNQTQSLQSAILQIAQRGKDENKDDEAAENIKNMLVAV